VGGEIQDSACAVSVTNTSGGGTDGLHLFGTSAEAYTDAALCSKPSTGGVYGVDWTGGRFESDTGVVADIAPVAPGTTKQFYIIAPNIGGSQGAATDSTHAITWLYCGITTGYGITDAFTTWHTIGVTGVNQPGSTGNGNLAGQVILTGGAHTVTFNPAFTSTPACTATDTNGPQAVQASSSPGSLSLIGASGHTVPYICMGNPN
jgi:hypothetical protein